MGMSAATAALPMPASETIERAKIHSKKSIHGNFPKCEM